MRNHNKQNIGKLSLLCAALVICFGMTTACSSSRGSGEANDGVMSGAEKSNVAANENERVENKSVENKQSAEPEKAEAVAVYDGRDIERTQKEATSAEGELFDNEFKNKESVIKQKFGDKYCADGDPGEVGIESVAKGSFTKPNALQTAFFYIVCSSGSSKFGVGGIMIFEGEKIVAHYAYGENGLDNAMFALPDVNKNGLSEIVLDGGGTHQGYTNGSIAILEFKNGNLENLGGTTTYESNGGAVEDDAKVKTTAYKITAQPSADPVFFREIYQKNGNAKSWTLSGKAEKFSIKKAELGKFIKITG